MTQTKYYTPTLEEFHVGFEFEILERNTNAWIRLTFNEYSSLSDVYTTTGHNKFSAIEAIKNNNLRVKCLDKEDIESLGFVLEVVPCGEDTEFDELGIRKINETAYYGSFYTKEITQNIEICRIIFTIKNKSELKKLLQQIQIIV